MNNYIMALFASGTTNFDYAGMGVLKDAFSAVATETATSNGNITYTMEMAYPVNGYLADKLVEGNLIKAQVSKTPGDYMIFEINETLKSDDTTITVYADAYANRILRMSFDNGGKFGSFGNVQQALNAARAQMTGIQSDFTLSSGIGTSLNMSGVTSKNTLPTTYQDFNAYLDAIMDKVQGNVRFGVNSIQIVSDRGRDITSTVLRDDKNTNGISIKVDTSNIVNRIIPMLPVLDKDGNVTQETKVGKIVTSSVAFKFINFYAGQVVSVDTQDLANSYFNRTNCDRPTTTATVQTSMLDEDLTDIRLFDRVQVYSSKIGYQAKLKVCERDFDILAGAVSTFKLGSSSVTIFNSQTSVVNALNSAVQSAQYAAITADGKNTAYYEGANPGNPKENDLWFHTVNGVSQIDQYINGNWVTIVSDSTGTEINKKVDQMGLEAKSAVDQAKAASDKVDQVASEFDDTNKKVDQALTTAEQAKNSADSLVDSVASAKQDANDAKTISNSVKTSYDTLTDGSTMTLAELENGLAAKLTKDDLTGYATETWTQNQIKVTADGINATLSSVRTDVDGNTTSINNLKADSSGFKAQFVTVNDSISQQTKDISNLQATSKSLSANFDSLSKDNDVNKSHISQLQLTADSFSTTLESVQQKVEDGLISTNIFRSANDFSRSYWTDAFGFPFTTLQSESRYHDSLIHYQGQGKTPAPYSTIAQQSITDGAMAADTWYTLSFYARGAGDNNTVGKFAVYFYGNGSDQSMSSSDGVEVLGTSDTHCIITLTPYFRRYVITFHTPKDFAGGHSFWARNDLDLNDGSLYCDFWHPKLELGKVASDFSVNPADTATISALSSISQTVDSIQTTVRGKVDNDTYQSKMTQIDNAIVTKVSKGDVTNENILPYSGYWSDTTGWTLFPWGASDKTLSLAHHNFYHNAVDATLFIQTTQNATAPVGSSKFTLIPNTTYTFSFWGFASSNVVGTNVYLLGRSYTSTKDYDFVHALFENLKMSPSGINKYTATFTTGPTETQAYIRLDNGGSNNGQSAGSYFAELKLEQGSIATPYTRVSSGEVQITSDNINLKVSKDGVVSAINISPESITIDGKRLHITAATYIDNAVIKDAMIANLSASKLTAGSINAANINVYNINGANIVANSITADKLQAGAMLIAMNSTLQTLKVGTDGLYTTNTSGTSIGKIHANNLVQHPENWGLDMDLSSTGQYMAWGAQNEGDPTGGYVIKFGWTRSSSASDFGMPWGGFWFNDNVMLHKNLRFDGGGIDVAGAYQLMKFAWISMNGTKYPFFGSSNLKAGWLFGSNETYLVRGDGVINASKILGVLNGQKYKFIKELNSNGSVKVYTDVQF